MANSNQSPQIKDIPTIKKTLETIRSFQALKSAMPILLPILKLFGFDTSQMKTALNEIDELGKLANDLASLPDEFNDLFASIGWIIHDTLDLEVAKTAVTKAKTENIEVAESYLVEYFSSEVVKTNLFMMQGVQAFHSRMLLAEKALIDYQEGRYYSCVPVILALMDGLVSELHEKHRGKRLGFFAEGVDLTAWDSITAHEKGLGALVKIFQTGRYNTTTEQITIPYRNGILHGRDLNYDNKIVAAKTWAALFAVRDWAVKAERSLLKEPAAKPQPSWSDLLKKIVENANDKRLLDQWEARSSGQLNEIIGSNQINDFCDGTPEKQLTLFLNHWKNKNYGGMSQCLWSMSREPIKKAAGSVRKIHSDKHLKDFKILSIKDESPAITEISVALSYEMENTLIDKEYVFRLLNEDKDGNPAVRGKPNTSWGITNWGF